MRKMIKRVVSVAAVISLIGIAMIGTVSAAEDRLTVKDSVGAPQFVVQDSGVVNINSGAFYWDAANKRLGIGTMTPSNPLNVSTLLAAPAIKAQRDNTDTTNAATAFNVANDDTTAGNGIAFSLASKDTYGGSYSGAVIGAIFTSHTGGAHQTDLTLRTTNRLVGSTPTERMRVTALGNVLAGNKASFSTGPLLTTDTAGFFFIPTVAGALTTCASVSSYNGGMAPIWYDTTNNKLCTCNAGVRKCAPTSFN